MIGTEGGRRKADSGEKEFTRAKNAAYRFLSYRPRSYAEVEKKLHDKGFNRTVVQDVLSDLVRLGYVDDEAFANQWVRGRVRLRQIGRHRIKQELKDRGLDSEVIRRVLGGVLTADLEIETARQAAERKLSTMKALDRETRRRRLAGFLERKGFSYDVIGGILKNTD